MRRKEFVKRVLVLMMCTALAVPAAGSAWTPLVVEATGGTAADDDKDEKDVPTLRKEAKSEIIDCYNLYKSQIKSAGNETAAANYVKEMIGDTDSAKDPGGVLAGQSSEKSIDTFTTVVKTQIQAYSVKETSSETVDTTPTTTNSNIMVGGSWVTPVANAGQRVNVVLPVVNMGRTRVKNVVVTPQISSDSTKWPFEIETSNYTQTIDRLPGTDDGGTDMERRRELTWTLKTRKDAPSGYMPLAFDVIYENDDKTLTTVTLTTYVNVVGTTGVSADGKSSTPRVIVTGFSTDPEVVHAGETFTLTLHMQNTSRATAVKNMLFDIQAASESSDTTYVAAAFLPTAGSSTVFVDQIAAGASRDITMELEARSDLAQKPYVVNVKMDYEDENVNTYENTASVSIPVRQEARIDISSVEVTPQSINVGSECNVTFSVYNTGKTKLYNTSVKFVADSISGGDTYLGNIEPGATSNLDAYITGAAATTDDGTIKIVITYEDESGQEASIEKEMTLQVNEPVDGDDMVGESYGDDMVDQQSGFHIWYVLLPLLLLAAAVAAVLVIRKKKKKKALELMDLEDDEYDEENEE
jgi:hypothetical protein